MRKCKIEGCTNTEEEHTLHDLIVCSECYAFLTAGLTRTSTLYKKLSAHVLKDMYNYLIRAGFDVEKPKTINKSQPEATKPEEPTSGGGGGEDLKKLIKEYEAKNESLQKYYTKPGRKPKTKPVYTPIHIYKK